MAEKCFVALFHQDDRSNGQKNQHEKQSYRLVGSFGSNFYLFILYQLLL